MPITLNGTTGIVGPDGSAASPAIQGSDANTGMFFPAADTVAIATGGSERMRIDSAGNVVIGTSSPGTSGLTVYRAGGAAISLNNAATGTAASSGFQLQGGSGGDAYLWNYSNSFIAIGTNNTERARIDSSGNLLVGGTSITPAQSNVSGFSYRAGIQLEIGAVNSQAAILGRSNDGQIIRFYNGGAIAGNISNSGTTTSYNGTSDYRLKEDVQPMTGALAKVASLKPCTFTWKNNGRAGQGFIAHELQQVIPDAVQGEKDAVDDNGNPDYQGIDPRMIVATLTAAIQEQQALIAALQADVAALKGQA